MEGSSVMVGLEGVETIAYTTSWLVWGCHFSQRRDGEVGSTYRVSSLRKGGLASDGSSVKVLPKAGFCLFRKPQPNKRYLQSDHSGFYDA